MLFKFRKKHKKDIEIKELLEENTINQTEDNVANLKQWHDRKESNFFNNKLHLSAFSGIMSLPSNLIKNDDNFNISYESNKYYGTTKINEISSFITKDFLNYKDIGITNDSTLYEEKDSILAGSDLFYNDKFYRYYTGFVASDVEFDPENTMTYTIVAEFDPNTSEIKKETKKVLFKMDRYKQTPVSRNPKCYYINGEFYIILGVQNYNSQAGLAVYKSTYPDRDFEYIGEIDFGDSLLFWESYFFVSPIYFKLEDKDVFLLSTVAENNSKDNKNANLNSSYFVIGEFNLQKLRFNVEKIQKVDDGFDFYGSRIFENNSELIMLSLISNTNASDNVAIENGWMNNLSLPRVLSFKDNTILQKVHPNIYSLRKIYNPIENEMVFENRLQNIIINNFNEKYEEKDFELEFYNDQGDKFIIKWEKGEFILDKSKSSFNIGNEFGTKWTKKISRIHFLEIFLDNSIIEIFVNHGEYTFTSKYYISGLLKARFTNLKGGAAFELNPINVKWRKNKTALVSGEIIVNDELKAIGSTYNVVERLATVKNNNVKLLTTIGKNEKSETILNKLNDLNVSPFYLSTNDDKRHSWYDFVLDSDKTVVNLEYMENINFDAFVLASSESLLSSESQAKYLELIELAKLRNKPFIYRPNLNSYVLRNLVNSTKESVLYPNVKEVMDKSWVTILDESELLTLTETNELKDAIQKTLDNPIAKNTVVVTENKVYLLTENNFYNKKEFEYPLDSFTRERLIDRSTGLLVHKIMRAKKEQMNRVGLWKWINESFVYVAHCVKFINKNKELEYFKHEHENLLLTKEEYDVFETKEVIEQEPMLQELIVEEPVIVDDIIEEEIIVDSVVEDNVEVIEQEPLFVEHENEEQEIYFDNNEPINELIQEDLAEEVEDYFDIENNDIVANENVDNNEQLIVYDTFENEEPEMASIIDEIHEEHEDCHFYVNLEDLENHNIDCDCEKQDNN
ncbi:GH32 C-terminal domain-containing protein [[Mycoplasma] collis]|uniref:GH32 C-terminal domain-containing protein n=1 Tax=[Mycoplasma] collis TaxID=2127 RepID=UPI00051B66FE|nr:PfkB family carbohydrate kinase [[Mycoplasma] collis]